MSGILRGAFAVATLLVLAWFVGQAMIDHHVVDEHTQTRIGLVIAAVVIVGGSIMFKVRSRRG
jgi:hypothetical protein